MIKAKRNRKSKSDHKQLGGKWRLTGEACYFFVLLTGCYKKVFFHLGYLTYYVVHLELCTNIFISDSRIHRRFFPQSDIILTNLFHKKPASIDPTQIHIGFPFRRKTIGGGEVVIYIRGGGRVI